MVGRFFFYIFVLFFLSLEVQAESICSATGLDEDSCVNTKDEDDKDKVVASVTSTESSCAANGGEWQCTQADSVTSQGCFCNFSSPAPVDDNVPGRESTCFDSRGNLDRLEVERQKEELQAARNAAIAARLRSALERCGVARSGVDSSCSDSPSLPSSGASAGSSVEACEGARDSASAGLTQIDSLRPSCERARSSILECHQELREVELVPDEHHTICGEDVTIEGGLAEDDATALSEGIQAAESSQTEASSFLSGLDSLTQELNAGIARAEQCIAQLRKRQPEEERQIAAEGPPRNSEDPRKVDSDRQGPGRQRRGSSSGLGELARGLSGGLRGRSPSSSSPSRPEAMPSPSRKSYSKSSSSSFSYSNPTDGGGRGYRGASHGGLGSDGLSAGAVDSGFNLNTASPSGGSKVPSSRASTGRGGRGGAGGGFAPSSGGGSSPTQAGGSRRGFASAKDRNLVLGFKSLKASNGGAGLSVKPNDFKKHGKANMQKRLAEAQKKFGKDMPLIFKNGQFVLDFLAMKESEAFKAKRAAMEKFWDGKSGNRQPTSMEELNVHQNANAKIWSLLNFRYRKEFYNVRRN